MVEEPESEWEPVTITDRKVGRVSGGQVQLICTLGGGFDREWAQSFITAGNKQGSIGFVMDQTPPRVSMEKVIEWSVPEGDMAGAVSYLRTSVEATNETYRRLQAKKRVDAEQRAKDEDAAAKKHEELQKKLDELG